MPTFNGDSIFGETNSIVTKTTDVAVQQTSYAGINGVEVKPLGTRGRVSVAVGTQVAFDPGGLLALELLAMNYNDGRTYTLVDNFGAIWFNVRLTSYEPQGRVLQDADGFFVRDYVATFQHAL